MGRASGSALHFMLAFSDKEIIIDSEPGKSATSHRVLTTNLIEAGRWLKRTYQVFIHCSIPFFPIGYTCACAQIKFIGGTL